MDIRYGRKKSGIKRELNKKIEDWLESIDNNEVKKAAAKDTIVTGGSIASMLLGEQVNDFDVYFRTKNTAKLVADYYINKFQEKKKIEVGNDVMEVQMYTREFTSINAKGFEEERLAIYIKSAGVASADMGVYQYFESKSENEMKDFSETLYQDVADDDKGDKYRVVFMSDNAVTLSHKVQIIIRFFGEPDKIHDNFDFIHAMNYYDYGKDELVLKLEALEAMMSRTLIYKGSLYPIASIFRTKKFIERGWRISAGQLLKIMWQINELDLSNMNVIREQLTGVDMAYLYQVIESLNDVDPEKINSVYVSEIIDRIFD